MNFSLRWMVSRRIDPRGGDATITSGVRQEQKLACCSIADILPRTPLSSLDGSTTNRESYHSLEHT